MGFLDIDAARGSDLLAPAYRRRRRRALRGRSTCATRSALRAAVDRVRTALGPVDALVNNAARDDRHATEEVTPEYFDERIATNFRHQFFAAQAVLPDMKTKGAGSDRLPELDRADDRHGRDAGLCRLEVGGDRARSARSPGTSGPFGIRVNVVAPGWIMTERQKTLWLMPEADAMRAERQCLNRRLQARGGGPGVVLFLASEELSAITAPDPRRRRRLGLTQQQQRVGSRTCSAPRRSPTSRGPPARDLRRARPDRHRHGQRRAQSPGYSRPAHPRPVPLGPGAAPRPGADAAMHAEAGGSVRGSEYDDPDLQLHRHVMFPRRPAT